MIQLIDEYSFIIQAEGSKFFLIPKGICWHLSHLRSWRSIALTHGFPVENVLKDK